MQLMDSSYENAYNSNGFSNLGITILVNDMGGHYGLTVYTVLTIDNGHCSHSVQSCSDIYEFVEYTEQATKEYADALVHAINEVRRLCDLANYAEHDTSVVVRDVVERFNRYASQFVMQGIARE